MSLPVEATKVKHVDVTPDQYYEWGIVATRGGKSKRYAEIEYYWHGDIWQRMVKLMKQFAMHQTSISFYKGARIDEVNKIVYVRGQFVRDYVADRHMTFWLAFFGLAKDDDVKIRSEGAKIQLPSIGDEDNLRLYVNGNDLGEILREVEEDAA